MVWCEFYGNGRAYLIVTIGLMNVTEYIEVLPESLLPFIAKHD